jgi:hypothetical protein
MDQGKQPIAGFLIHAIKLVTIVDQKILIANIHDPLIQLIVTQRQIMTQEYSLALFGAPKNKAGILLIQ